MFLIMQSFPASSHFLSHSFTYSPQRPILKHPQSVFFSQCERPNFTSVQNNSSIFYCMWILYWGVVIVYLGRTSYLFIT
jgi:hypothetical protein